MDKESSRNTIIFIVAAFGMFLLYQQFVLAPAERRARSEAEAEAAQTVGKGASDAPLAPSIVPLEQALSASPRISIDTASADGRHGLTGSVALRGGRFDHLFLKGYRETLDRDAELVELLRPAGAEFSYFASTGWAGQNIAGLPDANTVWTAPAGATLTPQMPVRLTYETPSLAFTRTIAVDDQYMFTVTDSVTNRGAAPVTLAPYAMVERQGIPPVARGNTSAEGYVRLLGEEDKLRLKLRRYQNWKKDGAQNIESVGGWLGLSDKYWQTVLIPEQADHIRARLGVTRRGGLDIFDATYTGDPVNLAPGATASETHRIFAGAKRADVLSGYQDEAGVPRFVDAIDWGFGYFITKPIFWLIKFFQGFVGNFGIAILMMTVVVKLVFFYPANLSFESMTKMKKVQPQMEKLKERHKDDPAGLQQAMMALYRDEKINPLTGCLPMLATIPVFLGLFHVLNTTIEMRHAPFYGWIQDLSSRDPTTIWNLFGLIPWNPASISLPLIGAPLDGFLHLGVWPLLYGLTMWLTQAMSPPATDPTQAAIMRWLPILFTFIMAGFPAGLLIYYTWSNLLTILQQYVIMRRFKVDNPIDGVLRRITGKPKPAG